MRPFARQLRRAIYATSALSILAFTPAAFAQEEGASADAGDEEIIVTSDDRDLDRFSSSHLPVGSRLSRLELLQLSLMSSENRAAAALARSYPGGIEAFVQAANAKARDAQDTLNREVFEESIQIIKKAWTSDVFSHHGKHWNFPPKEGSAGHPAYAKFGMDASKVLGGLGIAIISTSQGLLTDSEANSKSVGGEVLAYVW